MVYSGSDFAACLFNPLAINLFTTYPRLRELQCDERLARYIIILYDPQSPIAKEFPEWIRRKQEAATIAGFDLEIDKENLAEIFSCINEDVLTGTHIFLRQFIHDRLWGKLVANEETFWEYQLRLLTAIEKTGKDKDIMSAIAIKTKLSEDMEAISQRIEMYRKEFYGGDEQMATAANVIRFNPENIASVLKEKRR